MSFQKYIGVDGCKAGWFYVGIDSIGECDFGVFKTLPDLWQANQEGTLILVDIPIGLPSKNNPSRECDTLARQHLSPLRHNSVFTPPCRQKRSWYKWLNRRSRDKQMPWPRFNRLLDRYPLPRPRIVHQYS